MWTQGTTCCPWSGEDRPGFGTWEDGVETDLAKVHARRPAMPTFAYYGSYGCCSPYNNEWYPDFNRSNASALWLHDDTGRAVIAGTGSPRGAATGYVYDLCNPDMLHFYKAVILRRFAASPHVHGVFFDEFDQFIEGGYGNTPWGARNPGGPYTFGNASRARLAECWAAALEEIVRFLAQERGMFAVPSTNAYRSQYARSFGDRQRDALARYGGFKFAEAFCPQGGSFPSWVCPTHETREACCLDQLLSIKEHAALGVPLMVHIEPSGASGADSAGGATGVTANRVQLAAFLIAAQRWSYVAVGNGWDGPSSFPLVPEYNRPLGAPIGNATVIDAARGVFARSFEHCEVWLNVSAWQATLEWAGTGAAPSDRKKSV
eukprot:g5481.t1